MFIAFLIQVMFRKLEELLGNRLRLSLPTAMNDLPRFPAQEQVGGDCKIPSLLYYDQYGVVRAAGAEALRESLAAQKEEEQWLSCPWFVVQSTPPRRLLVSKNIVLGSSFISDHKPQDLWKRSERRFLLCLKVKMPSKSSPTFWNICSSAPAHTSRRCMGWAIIGGPRWRTPLSSSYPIRMGGRAHSKSRCAVQLCLQDWYLTTRQAMHACHSLLKEKPVSIFASRVGCRRVG